ncbi:adenosylcobinamide-phosphate synthase CbiB [Garciella nitratireducens]|uniref:adenosylcobinamide-phosphate synthase CbiB n=1 Tax=Garciella nitratireducens TaxID=218205 RepID=UPI000DEA5DF9|nr:adenosylcobinamide-phosphate synthase CbiB [Garciella nitratireducens]RBP41552.1 adenosylcobinamide-phosphate synthase [Garciella nitratireducens]
MERRLFLCAVVLDYLLGDPINWPHPIVYIGKVIAFYEKQIRKTMRNLKFGGILLVFFSLITVIGSSHIILKLARKIHPILESFFILYFIYALLAAKCLHIESKKVYQKLQEGEVEQAREKISYLVGRDTSKLGLEEITRATIETVAENTIDGVIAPMFYGVIGFCLGYPIEYMLFYKTVNTLDSMVGYIQQPYKDIGYASAKLDDILNYIPARIGSIFMILAGGMLGYDVKNAFSILKRDRRNHKSPNCAYPESAVAGLLHIQLGGSNIYFGQKLEKPTIGDKTRSFYPQDILSTIRIMYASQILFLVVSIGLLSWI